MVLSRRASKFEDESEVASFMIARLLPKEALHISITKQVWGAFMRGEFDSAVFQATKAVEVAVHEALGKPENLRGTDLMRKAFHAETGQLTDPNVEKGERDAMAALFAGAIGTFKNPHSHRNVSLEDPLQAVEIIMTANHLLRIVDDRKS